MLLDPELHEPLLTEKGEDGKILEVLQKGYYLCDTVLRKVLFPTAIFPSIKMMTGIV